MSAWQHSLSAVTPVVCLDLLREWFTFAEGYWYDIPGQTGLGCFGTGYDHNWGIQTNLKYVGAMAAFGVLGERSDRASAELRGRAIERALAALRYDLSTHLTGDLKRMDGGQWGHGWITGLGLERAMFGIYLLDPLLTDEDRAAIRRVLTSEADWLLDEYEVVADPWGHSGRNRPESNMWNGALLWRSAMMYPDHPRAAAWQEKAHAFLMNAITVPADGDSDRVVAGKAVREWFVGANFFPHYALDHHGYTNVGYSVVTLSNAAMLHYDARAQGLDAPESLYYHNAELWDVVRRMVFSDGRLARIGGDSRVRYAYCQDYLLPVLVYAADRLGDAEAVTLLRGQLDLIRREARFSADGSFYGRRLRPLARNNPYYYARLESDRAVVLGMVAAYLKHLHDAGRMEVRPAAEPRDTSRFEQSVGGAWSEPDYGAVLHRSKTRFASYAWRAHGLTQGMCQPPDDGHLAEWHQNLTGVVRMQGDDGIIRGGQTTHRRLERQRIETFDGGFLTYGAVTEGLDLAIDEGWRGEQPALHQIVFVALPDGRTVVGLEHCRTLENRCYLAELKGLHLNVPNDLYNGFRREISVSRRTLSLVSPPDEEELLGLGSTWASVDGRVGVVGLYGAEELCIHRSPTRRGGRYQSVYVEEVCWPCAVSAGVRSVDPNTTILDVGWLVLSGATAQETEACARTARAQPSDGEYRLTRWACVTGWDDRTYVVVANFGRVTINYPMQRVSRGLASARDLVTQERLRVQEGASLPVAAGQARVLELNG